MALHGAQLMLARYQQVRRSASSAGRGFANVHLDLAWLDAFSMYPRVAADAGYRSVERRAEQALA
jgi:hypothetical protein